MAWRVKSADAFVAEIRFELSSGSRRRNKCPEYIQFFCPEAANFGPLWLLHVPFFSAVSVAASVALQNGIDVRFASAATPAIPEVGVPLDGTNGAARAEVTRRSVAVTRDKERILLALLISK